MVVFILVIFKIFKKFKKEMIFWSILRPFKKKWFSSKEAELFRPKVPMYANVP